MNNDLTEAHSNCCLFAKANGIVFCSVVFVCGFFSNIWFLVDKFDFVIIMSERQNVIKNVILNLKQKFKKNGSKML